MNSLGKNTGVGSHSLLQKIFPTQGPKQGLPRCKQILYCQTVKQVVESERVGTLNVLSGNEGKRRRGWQRMRWLDSIVNSMELNLNKLQEIVKDRGSRHAAIHRVSESDTTLKPARRYLSYQHPTYIATFCSTLRYLISGYFCYCFILKGSCYTHFPSPDFLTRQCITEMTPNCLVYSSNCIIGFFPQHLIMTNFKHNEKLK